MSALFYVGWAIGFVGAIWLLVVAFKKSVGWGIASLLIPFANVVFAFMNWQDSKKPFLVMVGGIVLCVIGGWSMISSGYAPQV
jgi:hypothetical protein